MFTDIYNANKKYDIIIADPAWRQAKGGKKKARPKTSGTSLDYPTLALDEIADILRQADSLTNDNAVMFLWTIDKYLHEAEQIATELGYKLHARMVWNKVTGIPSAFTVRYGHEYLLYLYKGKLLKIPSDMRGKYHTVFTEQVKRHSEKPLIAKQMIDNLYPNASKIELFARANYGDWDCWGNDENITKRTV